MATAKGGRKGGLEGGRSSERDGDQKNATTGGQRITTCLWFDSQAEEAAKYYVSIFRNSRINAIARYPDAGREIHGQQAGKVMTVAFQLDGRHFQGLNGGPHFKFNEAVSLVVNCKDQKEIDYYWEKLRAGGDPNAQQCGWLKDKYGLSWQVVPPMEAFFAQDPKSAKAKRAMDAMLKMKKIDIAELRRAAEGE